jgi:ribosomal protein S18 acetylase RimI-like enzyme
MNARLRPQVTLAPMTPQELDGFIREEIADCASAHVRDGSWPRGTSLALAREELAPVTRWEREATRVSGQHLLAAHSGDGLTVGWLWVKLPPPGPWAGSAFLCQMTVARAHRRQGYGRSMLTALEEWLTAAGMTELRLNVCQENHAAKALYATCGYEVWQRHQTMRQLRKRLPAAAALV